jgi:hypothetical protein
MIVDNDISLNKQRLQMELKESKKMTETNITHNSHLYPHILDPKFNEKIANKEEFYSNKYNGTINRSITVEEYADKMSNATYELQPHQLFVKYFLSSKTPYNTVHMFHGVGSGKTCSAIGVCEEMRESIKSHTKRPKIIIIASEVVRDNFKVQLFDDSKLVKRDGIWTMTSCTGNKFLKEVNQAGILDLPKKTIVRRVKHIIREAYTFFGYEEFANYIITASSPPNDLNEIFQGSLLVIDEVQNIRMTDDSRLKKVGTQIEKLVRSVSQMRLIMLSATPMFNSHEEIIWLTNLMNLVDKRPTIKTSDIFKKNGDFTKNGKELFVRKITGYVSFVRGENPFTFPYRVYPSSFSPQNTFGGNSQLTYPTMQMNNVKILREEQIKMLDLYLHKFKNCNNCGTCQACIYSYIINSNKQYPNDDENNPTMAAMNYHLLQIPIMSLIMAYPSINGPIQTNQINKNQVSDDIIVDIADNKYNNKFDAISSDKSEFNKDDDVFDEGSDNELDINMDTIYNKLEPNSKDVPPNSKKDLLTDTLYKTKQLHKIQLQKYGKHKNKQIIENENENSGNNNDNTKVQNINGGTITQSKVSVRGLDSLNLQGGRRGNNNSSDDDDIFKIGSGFDSDSGSNSDSDSDSDSGSDSDSDSNSDLGYELSSDEQPLNIDSDNISKHFTGENGLETAMNIEPGNQFSYNKEYANVYPNIFARENIGKYSWKIKNIIDSIYSESGRVSDGIILVYSQYIKGGLIPMALALESIGMTRYNASNLFKTPPTDSVDSITMKSGNAGPKAAYTIITGDTRFSPNKSSDIKAIKELANKNGHIIKVILISKAGSEGIDLKYIRQVHILDPWYNINLLEQVIGRAVRHLSHKELEFAMRNVLIFIYGTILNPNIQEASDLFILRTAEKKAIQIGKITRLLKETAIDYYINHDQTNFSQEYLKSYGKTRQVLSNGQILNEFKIGDAPFTSACDYMETCQYGSLANKTDIVPTSETNTEPFVYASTPSIINKIQHLFTLEFFYHRDTLFNLLRAPPNQYSLSSIYAALSVLLNDPLEVLVDAYGRPGKLINIDTYYLFQPKEISTKNTTLFELSVPVEHKNTHISISLDNEELTDSNSLQNGNDVQIPKHLNVFESDEYTNTNVNKPIATTQLDNYSNNISKSVIAPKTKKILAEITKKYKIALNLNLPNQVDSNAPSPDSWYEFYSNVIGKFENNLYKTSQFVTYNTDIEPFVKDILIDRLIETLSYDNKLDLVNYLYSLTLENLTQLSLKEHPWVQYAKQYFEQRTSTTPRGVYMLMYKVHPNNNKKTKIIIKHNETTNKWVPISDDAPLNRHLFGKPEFFKFYTDDASTWYSNPAKVIGFISYEKLNKTLVFKSTVVDQTKKRTSRNIGARCNDSTKKRTMEQLNKLFGDTPVFTTESTKKTKKTKPILHTELCVVFEILLRAFDKSRKDGKIWMITPEIAMLYKLTSLKED